MSVMNLSARLDRTDNNTPWGFRMHGGADYRAPLTIQRVTPGSLAAKCGLQVGDAILKIGEITTDGLPHKQAQQKIIGAGNSLVLSLQRGGGVVGLTQNGGPAPAPYQPQQPQQQYRPPQDGYGTQQAADPLQPNYNTAPQPFSGGGGGGVPMGMLESLNNQTSQMNLGGGGGGGGGAGEDSPPPLPAAPPPSLTSSQPPLPSNPPAADTTISQARPTLHVPGFRSVKPQLTVKPQLSPKPARHNIGSRDSPVDSVKKGPTPFRGSATKTEEPAPGYLGLSSNTGAQSRRFKQLQMMVDNGDAPVPPWQQSDPNDTLVMEEERKKIYVPSETKRIVEDNNNKVENSAVSGLFSALAAKDSSPAPSDRGYGSDRGSSDDGEAKKILYASDTFRAVQEEEKQPAARPAWSASSGKPAQSRTLSMLQRQLDGGGAPAPRAAPAPAPAAAPARPAPAAAAPGSWAPKVPTGPRKMKLGRAGEAKSMPAAGGGRIPICNSCGVAIRGPFVSAVDKTWCPNHFLCANPHCRMDLIGVGFVEEAGQLYCEQDYGRYLAPRCGKCGNAIIGTWVSALETKFHPHCFLCCHCRQPILDGRFHVQDGEPYCEKDWAQMFQTKCYGCQFPIEPGDRWVEALNENWHSECFNCSTCQCNLEGQPFFAKQGKPYCKKHAMTPRF